MRGLGATMAGLAMLLAGGAPAAAGEWDITPSVSVSESFTDNAQLAPPGQAQWDFVTNLTPAISVHGEGGRVTLDLDASINGILYARDGSLDDVLLNLIESNRTELISDMLFLDTRALVSQYAVRPGDTVSGSQSSSQQGATVGTLLVSPYLRNHFGDFGDSEVRYTLGQVLSGSSDIANSTTNELSAQLVSGARFNRLRWTLTGDAAYTLQGGANDNNNGGNGTTGNTLHLLARADAEYVLTREWSLLAGIGYEKIQNPTLDTEPDGPIGDIGFHWRPGPRLSLVLQFNHRFDDNFLSGSLSYQIGSATLLTANYSEGIQTTQGLLAEDVGFLTTDPSGNFIDARTAQLFSLSTDGLGFQNSAFRQRLFEVDLSSVFGLNHVNAHGYYITQTGGQDVDEKGFGGSLGWTRDLSENDQASATVRYQHVNSHGGDNQTDDTVGVGVSVSHKFSETLQGVVLYTFTNRFSPNQSDRYRENVVTVGLVKTFK
jgi:uncharacterized protein (PEP-CTERM system associated)